MRLRSPPKVAVPGATSLARIQSQPLRSSLRRACSTTFSVSAAKPTTRLGRWLPACDSSARMSGFCANSSEGGRPLRSEEHTSELQSLMRISYAVFCLKKQKQHKALKDGITDETGDGQLRDSL